MILAPSLLTPSAPAPAAAGYAEARAKTAGETVAEATRKAMMEMVEPLYDDDRRRETKVPGRAEPIRKEFGIGVVDRVRVVGGVGRGRGRRHLVDLRRQPRRILGDLPAPVGLRAGLDECLPRLPAYRDRSRIAATGRLIGWGPAGNSWQGCSPRRPAGPAAPRIVWAGNPGVFCTICQLPSGCSHAWPLACSGCPPAVIGAAKSWHTGSAGGTTATCGD